MALAPRSNRPVAAEPRLLAAGQVVDQAVADAGLEAVDLAAALGLVVSAEEEVEVGPAVCLGLPIPGTNTL